MARRYSFEVTEKDIAEAMEGDSFNCMVAEAIKRQQPGVSRVEVDLQTIRWSDKDGRHVFLTPYVVAGYIVAFDAGEEIHPFDFSVRNAVPALQKKALTPAAKAVHKADSKLANARAKQRKAERVISVPESSPAQVALAKERIEEAEQTIVEAKQERDEAISAGKAQGMKVSKERTSSATRRASPRVIKTKNRVFGGRQLRVNQEEDRTHTVSRDV